MTTESNKNGKSARTALLHLLLDPSNDFVLINQEIKVQNVIIKQTRVVYAADGDFTDEPCVYLSLPFLTNQVLNTNLSKSMIPLMTENKISTISMPDASFSLSTKVPQKIFFQVCNELAQPLAKISFVEILFEFELSDK